MNDVLIDSESSSENFRKLPNVENGLSDKQRSAIELLAAGRKYSEVAAAVSVDPRSLYTWRKNHAFRAELDRVRREMWRDAADRLRALVHPSLDILEQHLGDRYDRARFRAAAAILRISGLRTQLPMESAECGE